MDTQPSTPADTPRPGNEPVPSRGQPARVLAAWIVQLVDDTRQGSVARFKRLAQQLQSEAFEWDNAFLVQAVGTMLDTARTLDFAALQRRGLWARITGGTTRRAMRFRSRHAAVLRAAAQVRLRNDELAKTYAVQTAGARRAIVELELEYQALDREIDMGVQWLADLSRDLIERQAAPGAEQDERLQALASRMESFTRNLKLLQGASTSAQEICKASHALLAHRQALLEMVRANLDGFEKVWARRAGNIAVDLADPLALLPELQKAQEAHAEVLKRLAVTKQANEDLQAKERTMAKQLQAFRQQMEELGGK